MNDLQRQFIHAIRNKLDWYHEGIEVATNSVTKPIFAFIYIKMQQVARIDYFDNTISLFPPEHHLYNSEFTNVINLVLDTFCRRYYVECEFTPQPLLLLSKYESVEPSVTMLIGESYELKDLILNHQK